MVNIFLVLSIAVVSLYKLAYLILTRKKCTKLLNFELLQKTDKSVSFPFKNRCTKFNFLLDFNSKLLLVN